MKDTVGYRIDPVGPLVDRGLLFSCFSQQTFGQFKEEFPQEVGSLTFHKPQSFQLKWPLDPS